MQVSSWQQKLLPFLVITISTLAICFIVFYFIHISDIEKALENTPRFTASASSGDPQTVRWNDLKDLEQFSIANRHYNARLMIRSRLLMISLSFLTGVVLCFIGSIFILGKFSEAPTAIEGGQDKISLKLNSSSPGIILACLGVIIIIVSILSKVDVSVSDAPLFMPESELQSNKPGIDTNTYPVQPQKLTQMDSVINGYRKKN